MQSSQNHSPSPSDEGPCSPSGSARPSSPPAVVPDTDAGHRENPPSGSHDLPQNPSSPAPQVKGPGMEEWRHKLEDRPEFWNFYAYFVKMGMPRFLKGKQCGELNEYAAARDAARCWDALHRNGVADKITLRFV